MLMQFLRAVSLTIAVAVTATAVETRVRVSEDIPYRGFTYSDRHWLEGSATAISPDTLTLRMTRGGGLVRVLISSVTELQVRGTPKEDWLGLAWPDDNLEQLRLSLGLSTPVRLTTPPAPEIEWKSSVAYIEEDGTEVLLIGDSVPATINQEMRDRLGLFSNIANFESAQYLRLRDGTFAVRLTTFDESGLAHTSVKPVSRAGLQALAARQSGTGSQLAPQRPREESAPALPGEAPRASSSHASILVYGGGAYHLVPDSDFTQELEALGLELSGANTRAGTLGAMFETSSRNYMDVALVVYGTRDRIVSLGQILEADFSVKSIEATWHRVLIPRPMICTLFTGFGAALVQDERRFGSLVDISDEVTAWPYSIGLRLISSGRRQAGFAGFAEVRYRWVGLRFKNSQTNKTTDFELGGPFLQFGVAYGL